MTTEYDDLTVLAAFLARRDEGALDRPADVLVLCGSAVLRSLTVAAGALSSGVAGRILVTGGLGHSTPYLRDAVRAHPAYGDTETAGRPEAAIIAEILVRHLDLPTDLVTTEEEATNCGENAEYSLRLLKESGMPRSLVLVQDPTMQRRTHAAFDRWRGPDEPEVRSHAPFVPVVGEHGVGESASDVAWSRERFRDLALGEISRLTDDERGYGPRGAGFIGHVEIPSKVAGAYARLRTTYPEARRDLTPRDGPEGAPRRL